MSAWFYLVVAGLLEVLWAAGLKSSAGFTKLVPSVLTVIGIGASMWMLATAARTIPLGTAYAVWVGIGVFGTVIVGATLFHEPIGIARMAFLALLAISIVGLKLTS